MKKLWDGKILTAYNHDESYTTDHVLMLNKKDSDLLKHRLDLLKDIEKSFKYNRK